MSEQADEKAPPASGPHVTCTIDLRGHGEVSPVAVTSIRNHCMDLFLACEAEGIRLTGGFQPAAEVQRSAEPPPMPRSPLAVELGV